MGASPHLRASAQLSPCMRYVPVAMDATAAIVHTTTVLPALRPRVCSTKPKDVSITLHSRPSTEHTHDQRRARMNPAGQGKIEVRTPTHTHIKPAVFVKLGRQLCTPSVQARARLCSCVCLCVCVSCVCVSVCLYVCVTHLSYTLPLRTRNTLHPPVRTTLHPALLTCVTLCESLPP